jgi:subtilisin family serine protease
LKEYYYFKKSVCLVLILLLVSTFYTPFLYAASSSSTVPISFPDLVKVEPSLRRMLSRVGFSNSDFVNVIVKVKGGSMGKAMDSFSGISGVKVLGSMEILPFIALSVNIEGLRNVAVNPMVEAVYPIYNVSTCMIPPQNRRIIVGNVSYTADFKANQEYPFIGTYPTHLSEILNIVNATGLYGIGLNGSGVVVAVLDTGIRMDHPNLAGKVVGSVSFVPEDPNDYNGHGTFVAGIIASSGMTGSRGFASDYGRVTELQILPGNETGIAPGVKLLNVKVLNSGGWGDSWSVMQGIDWAVRHGADVISMSLGGYPVVPPEWDPLCTAVEWATRMGVVVVVAAGNEGPGHFSVTSPSYMPSVISVGACYETDIPAFFSGRGPAPYWMWPKPDVMAPGVAVISTYAGFDGKYTTLFGGVSEGVYYCEGWGTSASAPVVSGVVALLLQAFRGASPEAIKAAIISGAKDMGFDETEQGAGIVNAYAAYEYLNSHLTSETVTVQPKYEHSLILEPNLWLLSIKGWLSGSRIALLVNDYYSDLRNLNSLQDLLRREGADISIFTYTGLDPNSLSGFNLVIAYNPRFFVNLTDLVLNSEVSLMVIGDDDLNCLNSYTNMFNVWWSPLAVGGRSTAILSHDATTYPYPVSSIYFGGAMASLSVGSGVTILARDPVYPAIAAWSQTPNTTSTYSYVMGNVTLHGNTFTVNMTLTTNQTSYYRGSGIRVLGRLMNVTGNISISNATIQFVVQGPSPTSFQLVTNDAGYFEMEDVVYSGMLYGAYRLIASYGGIEASCKFIVITRGRFVAVSDNDLFTDEFIERDDNGKLLVDLAVWLSRFEHIPRPTVGVLKLTSFGPIYAYSNSSVTYIFEASNVGNDDLNVTLNGFANFGEKLLGEMHFVNVTIKPGEKVSFELNFKVPPCPPEFYMYDCSIFLKVLYTPYVSGSPRIHLNREFYWGGILPVVDKPHRMGLSVNVSSMLPMEIDSKSAPLIAMFPGDFKLVNLEFISSSSWKDLRFEVVGNVSNVASLAIFEKPPAIHRHPSLSLWWLIYTIDSEIYETTPSLFNHGSRFSVGSQFNVGSVEAGVFNSLYLQVEIPKSINPGNYVGYVRVLNGSSVLCEVPVNIDVRIPVAKVLQDDVFQLAFTGSPYIIADSSSIAVPLKLGFMYVERLYSGQLGYLPTVDLFNWWSLASEYGFDIDPLLQTMFDRGIDDPWALIFSSEYRALALIGCERWLFRTEALQNLFAQGKGILFAYGFPEFPLFHSYVCDDVKGEWWSPLIFGGLARDYINHTHPLAWGVDNVTHIMATTLTVGAGADVVMSAVECVTPKLYREHISGVTVASYEYVPTQAKYVAIGDHMLFTYGLIEDLNWLFMYTLTGVNALKTGNAMLTVNALKYVTNDPPSISISLAPSYSPGDNVTINITVEDLYGVDSVNVTVYNPLGSKVLSKVYSVSSSKAVLPLQFKLEDYAPLGDYSVVVRAIDNMMDYSVKTSTFKVTGLESKVLSGVTLASDFTPKSVFKPGETVIVNATLACRASVKANVYIQVLTPDNVPLNIGVVGSELPVGKVINVANGFTLPLNIPLGSYTVKIYVWYSVPGRADWRPLADVYTTTFTVSGG